MDLTYLKADDPVRVFDRIVPERVPPAGYEGTVSSVGRRYLVVAFVRGEGGMEHEIRVDRETGWSPDSARQFQVMTPEVADVIYARRGYQEVLRSVGITVNMHEKRPPDELLARLVAVVQEYQKTEETSGTG